MRPPPPARRPPICGETSRASSVRPCSDGLAAPNGPCRGEPPAPPASPPPGLAPGRAKRRAGAVREAALPVFGIGRPARRRRRRANSLSRMPSPFAWPAGACTWIVKQVPCTVWISLSVSSTKTASSWRRPRSRSSRFTSLPFDGPHLGYPSPAKKARSSSATASAGSRWSYSVTFVAVEFAKISEKWSNNPIWSKDRRMGPTKPREQMQHSTSASLSSSSNERNSATRGPPPKALTAKPPDSQYGSQSSSSASRASCPRSERANGGGILMPPSPPASVWYRWHALKVWSKSNTASCSFGLAIAGRASCRDEPRRPEHTPYSHDVRALRQAPGSQTA
mmetsp:Transcript_30261/g.100295  ORF Transcript_30261/g.100295 Transcript_30261/m.100295 type:complete len:337 (+) Transcript_30261:855-1865(+)